MTLEQFTMHQNLQQFELKGVFQNEVVYEQPYQEVQLQLTSLCYTQ